MVKIHSQEWFDKNAYRDSYGEYWENIGASEKFEDTPMDKLNGPSDWLYPEYIGKTLNIHDITSEVNWAIEKTYKKEEYPEYYL